jgi:hypothetical protein
MAINIVVHTYIGKPKHASNLLAHAHGGACAHTPRIFDARVGGYVRSMSTCIPVRVPQIPRIDVVALYRLVQRTWLNLCKKIR